MPAPVHIVVFIVPPTSCLKFTVQLIQFRLYVVSVLLSECCEGSAATIYAYMGRGPRGCFRTECCTACESIPKAAPRGNCSLLPKVAIDPERQSKLRQDYAFFSDPDLEPESKFCENLTRIRSHFSVAPMVA